MAVDRIELDELVALRGRAQGIDLHRRRRVTTDRAGGVTSAIRGRGMDFEEHRPYQPGDESRNIDWRVTARTGRMHVRVYREERDRPVLIVVDLRSPMWFGSRGCFKAVLAARATAVCAWAARARGDRVGGVVFGDGTHEPVRPDAGGTGVLRLLRALQRAPRGAASATTSDLSAALQQAARMAHAGGLVAVFSDFRGWEPAQGHLMRRLARSAQLVIGFVHDPLEAELPPAGVYPLALATGRAPALLATHAAARRTAWRQAFAARRAAAEAVARDTDGLWLDLCTARPLPEAFDRAFGRASRVA